MRNYDSNDSTMKTRAWILVAVAVCGVIAAALLTRSYMTSRDATAQTASRAPRAIPVVAVKAEKKAVPVRIDALGNVTPIASVAIKTRIDSTIVGVHFQDGARVKQGDLLFTLDSRQIEAQIDQAEGVLARDRAQLDQNERDVQRLAELVGKGASAQVSLDNMRTQADITRASIKANEAALQNLKVQLDFTRITAPIAGRMSQANVKIGNVVRSADAAALATINQISPIYVSFTVSQRMLPDIRKAIAAESATIEAIVPGDARRAVGTVAMIENTVDPATGMVTVRASMPNKDEVLWPGTLVTAELTLRSEEAVAIPSVAVQVSQNGPFVFLIKDNVAKVQPVTVERTFGDQSVISSGLEGGETVATDGQLLLSDGTPVSLRSGNSGAGS